MSTASNFLKEAYPKLMQHALEAVLQGAMSIISTTGTGGNAVNILFNPHHPKARCPIELTEQYPSGMPIVLQNQWRNLILDDECFHVILFFDGVPTPITVPWQSIMKFYDETAQFGIDMTDFTPEPPFDTTTTDEPQGDNVVPLFPNNKGRKDS